MANPSSCLSLFLNNVSCSIECTEIQGMPVETVTRSHQLAQPLELKIGCSHWFSWTLPLPERSRQCCRACFASNHLTPTPSPLWPPLAASPVNLCMWHAFSRLLIIPSMGCDRTLSHLNFVQTLHTCGLYHLHCWLHFIEHTTLSYLQHRTQ